MTVIILVCSFIILIVATIGCSNLSNKDSYLKSIGFSELKKMIKDKKTFILYISNKNCPNCKAFEPKLKKVVTKYKIEINKLDDYYLTVKEFDEMQRYTNVTATPTIEFFDKGEEKSTLNRLVGNHSEDDIIEMLIDNDYIKNKDSN